MRDASNFQMRGREPAIVPERVRTGQTCQCPECGGASFALLGIAFPECMLMD